MSEHMGDLQEHRKPVEINTQLNASEKKHENEHIEDEIFKHDYKHEEELANANRQGQPNPQEQEDQKQQNLQVIVKKVNAHLPGPLPQAVKQKLSGKHSEQEKDLQNDAQGGQQAVVQQPLQSRIKQEKQVLPADLRRLIKKVSEWKKVRRDTSAPVKEIAEQLKESRSDAEAALNLAILYNSCIHYLYENNGKWFKSSERREDVTSILKGIIKFAHSDARAVYQEELNKQIASLRFNYDEHSVVRSFIDELAGNKLETEGEVEANDLSSLAQKRRAREERGAEYLKNTNWTTLEEGAKSILREQESGYGIVLANRPTVEFHQHVTDKSVDTEENRKKDAALLFKKVLKYQIPDVNGMSDYDILTDPDLRQLVTVDYRTMINDINRLIGFGYAKDYDEIRRVKIHMAALNMVKEVYETRLKVIAGEGGIEDLVKLTGYGETREKMEELAAGIFDRRMKGDLDKFAMYYKAMHGKKASKAVLDARREIIEKRRSHKKYIVSGYESLEKVLNFPEEVRLKNDLRTLEAVTCYGKSTFVKKVPVTDENGTVTGYRFEEKERTKEDADEMAKNIQSDDVVKKYGAYRAAIDDFLHKDYSLLYDCGTEEKMFENYEAKRILFAAADEMLKFIDIYVKGGYDETNLTPEQKTQLHDLGFPLSPEEEAEIRGLTDWCASISQVVSMRHIALKGDDSEIIGLEDAREIKDAERREYYLNPGVEEYDYGGPGGEEAHAALIPQINGDAIAQVSIKPGAKIHEMRNKCMYIHYYDGFKDLLNNGTISDGLEARKNVKLAYAIANKVYEGDNAAADIQKDKDKSMQLISKYAKPLSELSRKDVLANINEFAQAGMQCNELESFCKKHGLELTEDERKTIDTLRENFDQKKLYIERYALLVNSQGMYDMHNFGFKLDFSDTLSPGITESQIAEMEKISATKYRKEALGHWKMLLELWALITKGEPELNCHVDSVINAHSMTEDELRAHQADYDVYVDRNEKYIRSRAANEEGAVITDQAVSFVTDLRLVKDDMDGDTCYDTCKTLSIDTAKCSQEDLVKKVRAMEDIFKFALLFEKDDFEISAGQPYYGKIDKRYAKVKTLGGLKGLYTEYKKLTEDPRFPKDSAFDGDSELQRKISYHIGALSKVYDRFAANKTGYESATDKLDISVKDAFDEADRQLNAAKEKKKLEESRAAEQREAEEKRKEIEALRAKEKEKKKKEEELKQQEELKNQVIAEALAEEEAPKEAPKKKLNKKQEEAQRRLKMKTRNKLSKKAAVKQRQAKEQLDEATEKVRKEQEAAAEKRMEILARVTVDKSYLTVEKKTENAQNLEKKVNKSIEDRVHFRAQIPLDVKKKVNYQTFEKFSEFAFLSGDQEELKKLILGYSDSHKEADRMEKLGGKVQTNFEKKVATLDAMSTALLKIDPLSFDVSSDEKIAEKAAELEKLSRAMDAYHHFLAEAGSDAYFKYLREKGENGEVILDRINKLTAISGYFRTKRLIMEDETYINYKKKRPMSAEPDKDDDFETERLKKLMKLSDVYATDMNRAYDPENTIPIPPGEIISKERKELMQLEQQRYSVAPMWMKNSLSFTKIPKRNKDENPVFCTALNKSAVNDVIYAKVVEKHGRQALSNFYTKEFPAMLKGNTRGASPTFKGAKDEYLEKISVSDSWARTYLAFVNCMSYRMTDEELKEMFITMKIQETDEWDKIKDDPEAVAFYESAFKEMAMKEISLVYANVKRVANSVGYKIMLMHPADLAMQVTTDLYVELMGSIVAANIDEGPASLENLRLLFENNTDGRYYFDLDDFHEIGSLTGCSTFKACNSGRVFGQMADMVGFDVDDVDPEADEEEVLKGIFGKKNIRELAKEQHDYATAVDKETKKVRDPEAKKFFAGPYYMYKHPELFTQKNFLKKAPNGKYILGHEMEDNARTALSVDNLPLLRKTKQNNRVKLPDEKEVRDYERSLIKRDMPKLILENDPYGIKGYYNNYEDYYKKDEKGNKIINKETGEYENINLMNEKRLQW